MCVWLVTGVGAEGRQPARPYGRGGHSEHGQALSDGWPGQDWGRRETDQCATPATARPGVWDIHHTGNGRLESGAVLRQIVILNECYDRVLIELDLLFLYGNISDPIYYICAFSSSREGEWHAVEMFYIVYPYTVV